MKCIDTGCIGEGVGRRFVGARRAPRGAGVIAALIVGLLAVPSVASAQVHLTFEKTAVVDGIWLGTVAGDVTGRLVTTMVVADQSTSVWDIELYWIVLADEPTQSFVALLSGKLDTNTGAVTMSGRVRDGYLVGTAVHETGQLQDARTSAFKGTITIGKESAIAFDLRPPGFRGMLPAHDPFLPYLAT